MQRDNPGPDVDRDEPDGKRDDTPETPPDEPRPTPVEEPPPPAPKGPYVTDPAAGERRGMGGPGGLVSVMSDGGALVNGERKERRGFASMSPEKQREIASKGGRAAHQKGTAHEWTSEEARNAGRKGGQVSRGGRGRLIVPTDQPPAVQAEAATAAMAEPAGSETGRSD